MPNGVELPAYEDIKRPENGIFDRIVVYINLSTR